MELDDLQSVVGDLDRLVGAVSLERGLKERYVLRILGILSQVIQVVEQAFQDVQSLLVDMSLLRPEEIDDADVIRELQQRTQLLTARSYYRDAAEICSKLKYLGDTFNETILPRVRHLPNVASWGGVFGLIEHREGRVITMVERIARELSSQLDALTPSRTGEARQWSKDRSNELRALLSELHMLNGRIMGYSSEVGFLELTSDRTRLEREVNIMVDNRDQSVTHGHRVSVSGGATVSGTLVVATSVTDAFKTAIGDSPATTALKDSLAELCEELDKLLPALSAQLQGECKKDLEVLITEATKTAPRKKWYELSADGLIDAAKTCGAMAAPVIAVVQRIVSLLSAIPT
jgi:hypothetical protein